MSGSKVFGCSALLRHFTAAQACLCFTIFPVTVGFYMMFQFSGADLNNAPKRRFLSVLMVLNWSIFSSHSLENKPLTECLFICAELISQSFLMHC